MMPDRSAYGTGPLLCKPTQEFSRRLKLMIGMAGKV